MADEQAKSELVPELAAMLQRDPVLGGHGKPSIEQLEPGITNILNGLYAKIAGLETHNGNLASRVTELEKTVKKLKDDRAKLLRGTRSMTPPH